MPAIPFCGGEVKFSKWLTYAEKKIEMPQTLSLVRQRLASCCGKRSALKVTGWIQIVSEVEA
jgi:hypothetical protein